MKFDYFLILRNLIQFHPIRSASSRVCSEREEKALGPFLCLEFPRTLLSNISRRPKGDLGEVQAGSFYSESVNLTGMSSGAKSIRALTVQGNNHKQLFKPNVPRLNLDKVTINSGQQSPVKSDFKLQATSKDRSSGKKQKKPFLFNSSHNRLATFGP